MKYKTLKQELIDNDERDENNRRIIHLNVTDDGNFLSPLSVKGNPLISGETAEFLNLNIKHNLKDSGVKLIISSNAIDETEKEIYKTAIKNYYRVEYKTISGYNNFLNNDELMDSLNSPFYMDDELLSRIKDFALKRIAIHSDNDPFIPQSKLKEFWR